MNRRSSPNDRLGEPERASDAKRRWLVAFALISIHFPGDARAAPTELRGAVIAGERPLAGARVRIYPLETVRTRYLRLASGTSAHEPLAEVRTAADGQFSLSVAAQPLEILIDARGFAPRRVAASRDRDLGVIQLAPAQPRAGLISSRGKPVGLATVTWLGTGGEQLSAVTTADGRYEMPDPDVWARKAIVSHPSLGTRAGAVQLDLNLDTAITIDGSVVAGGVVTATASVLLDGWPVAKSGPEGRFTFRALPDSWQQLWAETSETSGSVSLESGVVESHVLLLAEASVVTGTISTIRGTPVPGAAVLLLRENSSWFSDAITDDLGTFRLGSVPPDTYRLHVHMGEALIENREVVVKKVPLDLRVVAPSPLRLAGVVVDDHGKRIAGAEITVNDSKGDLSSAGLSGAKGEFSTLAYVRSSEVDLAVTKEGHVSNPLQLRIAPGREAFRDLTLKLRSKLVIAGMVVDESGKPLANVLISSQREELGSSGVDGTFRFYLDEEHDRDLYFHKDGFGREQIRIAAGHRSEIEVKLRRGGEVSGRIVDGAGPLSGIGIEVESEPSITATSDAQGKFRLGGLPNGRAILLVTRPGLRSERHEVVVPGNDQTLRLQELYEVRGRVVEKVTRRPIASFSIGESSAPALFNAGSGEFRLDLPPGNQVLVVSGKGIIPEYVEVKVVAGLNEALEIPVEQSLQLTGSVRSAGGQSLPSVSVRALDPQTGVLRDSFTTTSSGQYDLSLPAGPALLLFSTEGFIDLRKTVDVRIGQPEFHATLERGIVLSGRLKDESGNPVNGGLVTLESSDGLTRRSAESGDDGSFHLEGLSPGSYRLGAEGKFISTHRIVTIPSGEITLQVSRGFTIRGVVRGLDPSAIMRTTVQAETSGREMSVDVAGDGSFVLRGISSGPVSLVAVTSMGNSSGTTSGRVTSSAEELSARSVELRFQTASISGRVTSKGRPVMDAFVSLKQGSEVKSIDRTDASGRYTLSSLPPGKFELSVESELFPRVVTFPVECAGDRWQDIELSP